MDFKGKSLEDYGIKVQKPPLGIMPRYIWDEKRMIEIISAMERYLEAKRKIPIEWVTEYNELVRKLSDKEIRK